MPTKTARQIALLAGVLVAAALVIGVVAHFARPAPVTPGEELADLDPQQKAVYAEARRMVLADIGRPSADFSDPATDHLSGAAELGENVWEAWGKVTYGKSETETGLAWHIAWNRKNRHVFFQKVGAKEIGNYADALSASKAYPHADEPAE